MTKKQSIAKLKELGAYEQFCKNLKNDGRNIKTYKDPASFWDFVSGAFMWTSTPEGNDFWSNIAEQ